MGSKDQEIKMSILSTQTIPRIAEATVGRKGPSGKRELEKGRDIVMVRCFRFHWMEWKVEDQRNISKTNTPISWRELEKGDDT